MEFKNELQQILNDNKDKPLVIESKTADTQNNVLQNKPTQAYEEARTVAEVQATKEILVSPATAIKVKISKKFAEHIDNSKAVANKIDETANRIVEKGLQAEENNADAEITKSEDAKVEADFNKNKNEYLYHAIKSTRSGNVIFC